MEGSTGRQSAKGLDQLQEDIGSQHTPREVLLCRRNEAAKTEIRHIFEGLMGKRKEKQTHCELSGLGGEQRMLGKLRKAQSITCCRRVGAAEDEVGPLRFIFPSTVSLAGPETLASGWGGKFCHLKNILLKLLRHTSVS